MVADKLESASEQVQVEGQAERSGVQLTARQEQILSLMQAGKVNKEIARELDISLGTVKQHVVAIFKKLNVSNRTMAASLGKELLHKKDVNRIHARRPCIVLSLRFSGGIRKANRQFYDFLSGAAFDHNAHFVHRDDGEGELVFGLKRSSEYDLRAALFIAGDLHKQLKQLDSSIVLYGALVAGIASVSQNRFGGWSGDAVASRVIARAHQLLFQADEDYLLLDDSCQWIMKAYDIALDGRVPEQINFNQAWQLNVWDAGCDKPLSGRQQELAELLHFLSPRSDNGLMLLDGESGMGKSRICRQLARESEKNGYQLTFLNVTPTGIWDGISCCMVDSVEALYEQLRSDAKAKSLLILDDVHLFSKEEKEAFFISLQHLGANRKVLLSGRQLLKSDYIDTAEVNFVHLSRMDISQVAELLQPYDLGALLVEDIANRSRGVPLFAIEMARGEGNSISIALVITIASRLDRFNMDWKLLYCLADQADTVSLNKLGKIMQDSTDAVYKSVKRAASIGVLETDGKSVRYRNSLVKEVVGYLFSGQLKLD